MTHPPGMVGVIAQETARFSTFAASLTALEVPPETSIKWILGHGISANSNQLVRAMLADPKCEWLWILGDDHVFGTTVLTRLLEHDVNIVAPLCLTRMPPYSPVMMSGFATKEEFEKEGYRRRLRLDDYPEGGLISIHSVGSAGLLVRRTVFEDMEDPWFEAGMVSGLEIGEDFYFCDKAREQYEIWGDLDTMIGHTTVATVWPARVDEGWTFSFGFTGGLQITMPVGWGDG